MKKKKEKGKMKKWIIVSLPGCPSPTDSEVNRNGADDMIIFRGNQNLIFYLLRWSYLIYISIWKKKIIFYKTELKTFRVIQ